MIYENCRIYGPYKAKQDGRKRVFIIFPDGTRKTVSYPKYLKEIQIGRYLTEDETVDHIDRNIENDDLSNLEIKARGFHSSQDSIRLVEQEFLCPTCEEIFSCHGKKLSDVIQNRLKKKAGPFCSRTCAGSYGKKIQLRQIEKLEIKEVIPEYFKMDKEFLKRK